MAGFFMGLVSKDVQASLMLSGHDRWVNTLMCRLSGDTNDGDSLGKFDANHDQSDCKFQRNAFLAGRGPGTLFADEIERRLLLAHGVQICWAQAIPERR